MEALTAQQAALVDTAHVVHGVDVDGAYLGLVARDQAAAVAVGPPPAAGWQWTAGQWRPPAPTLAELKAECWQAIKTARQLAMQGTFTCGGLVYDIDPVNITGATTLTTNRAVTLSTTAAVNGDRFRIVRTGLGAFTLDVGGLKTIPSATAAWVDVEFDGTAWRLTGYGTL